MDKNRKIYLFLPFGLLIFTSLLLSWPFFHKGFFTTDDGIWAIVRLAEMIRELRDGQFPPRWSDFLNHGYGYPLFSFTYPLPFYLGALLKIIGFSLTTSIKLLFISSVVLSGLLMYLLLKKITSPAQALIASMFYLLAPYRLTDLYIRGSLGESLSFVLFPLIFLSTVKVFEKPTPVNNVFLALSVASMYLTHNVMALFIIPVWVFFIIIYHYNLSYRDRFGSLLNFTKIFIISFGLSAYFIIPALLEKQYLNLSVEKLADQFNYFLTFGNFLENLTWPVIIIILLSLSANLIEKNKLSWTSKCLYWFSFCLFLISSFFTQKLSSIFWQMPPLNSVDFPLRIMGLTVFFSSILIAFVAKNKIVLFICSILLCISLFSGFNLTKPNGDFYSKDDSYFFTNDATTTSKDELMPIWVKFKPLNRYRDKVEIVKGDAVISGLKYNSRSMEFNLEAVTPGTLKINTIYFPGWRFSINSKKVNLEFKNPHGLIYISYPQGDSIIKGKFTRTEVRLFADIISMVSLISLVYYLYVRKI